MNIKLFPTHRFRLFLMSLVLFSFGCNDDDDSGSGDGPPPVIYPKTFTFHDIENMAIFIVVEGETQNTSGMTPADVVPPEDLPYFSGDYYKSIQFTFTEDSVYNNLQLSGEAYAYILKQDSVFVKIPDPFTPAEPLEVLYGTGWPQELRLPYGYHSYCVIQNNISSCNSETNLEHYDVSDFENELPEGMTDSLIICNVDVVFN